MTMNCIWSNSFALGTVPAVEYSVKDQQASWIHHCVFSNYPYAVKAFSANIKMDGLCKKSRLLSLIIMEKWNMIGDIACNKNSTGWQQDVYSQTCLKRPLSFKEPKKCSLLRQMVS